MPFMPGIGQAATGTMTAGATSANAAIPTEGGGMEVEVYNADSTNDAYVEFGPDNTVQAVVPLAAGPVLGSMPIPAGAKRPVLLTMPPGTKYWAVIAPAGSPKVYLTRGRLA